MLEFKNVSVRLSSGRLSAPFSLELDGGNVACLSGSTGSGKSLLLMAILGLAPLASGYVTVDGELVTSDSSAYFRRLIAYVPQRMPSLRMKVRQLFDELFGLDIQRTDAADASALAREWQRAQLPAGLADQWVTSVDALLLRTAMLAAVPLLRRPIVLVDDPDPQVVADGFLDRLATDGTEVLFATRRTDLPCHNIIKL